MRVLLIDFDGVVHSAGSETEGVRHFEWLPILTQLLTPWPDVWVAVHSTWRYTHSPAELRELLGPLGTRFLGCVPRGPRAEAIRWFVHLNPGIESVLVLDDAPREFPSDFPEQLVVCNPLLGISEPRVQARISHWLASVRVRNSVNVDTMFGILDISCTATPSLRSLLSVDMRPVPFRLLRRQTRRNGRKRPDTASA